MACEAKTQQAVDGHHFDKQAPCNPRRFWGLYVGLEGSETAHIGFMYVGFIVWYLADWSFVPAAILNAGARLRLVCARAVSPCIPRNVPATVENCGEVENPSRGPRLSEGKG